jgi:hypothetical protein
LEGFYVKQDHQAGVSTGSETQALPSPRGQVAKVVPITPLPFRAVDRNDLLEAGEAAHCYWEIGGGRGYLPSDELTGFCLRGFIHVDDARYIVHAANAYPKLVAALQALTETGHTPEDAAEYRRKAMTAADDLLAELGEIE